MLTKQDGFDNSSWFLTLAMNVSDSPKTRPAEDAEINLDTEIKDIESRS